MTQTIPSPPEIDITSEMIEAAYREFVSFDSRLDMLEDKVCEIYSAMSRAKSSDKSGMSGSSPSSAQKVSDIAKNPVTSA